MNGDCTGLALPSNHFELTIYPVMALWPMKLINIVDLILSALLKLCSHDICLVSLCEKNRKKIASYRYQTYSILQSCVNISKQTISQRMHNNDCCLSIVIAITLYDE